MILLGDIEANSLTINKDLIVHCIVLMNWETKDVYKFPPDKLVEALTMIQEADRIVMHNYIRYDKVLLKTKYPKLELPDYDDTLVMSQLFNPDRAKHSIESYGIECGIWKPEHEDWSTYSPEMLNRCTKDVLILDYVYTKCMKEMSKHDWAEAVQLEYDVAEAHLGQVERGVLVNQENAKKLVDHLDGRLNELATSIYEQLPLRCVGKGEVSTIFKKNKEYRQHVKNYFGLE